MKRISIIFLICLLIPFCVFAYNDTNKTYKQSIPFGDIRPRNLMYDAETTDRLVYDSEEEMEVFLNSEIESEHMIDLSTNKNQFYDIDSTFINFSTNVYILKLPPCSSSKAGKLNLYLHQSPVNGFQYDISDENISESSIPNNRYWMTDENDAIWKLTFESLPGTTEWILVRYLKHTVEPFEHEYSIFFFNDRNVIYTNMTSIPEGMYKNNTLLSDVRLGNNITNIEKNAFNGCSNLKSISISPNLLNIDNDAFYRCYKLNDVYINDLKSWCEIRTPINWSDSHPLRSFGNLYLNGKKITGELQIPEGTKNIGNYAFYHCTDLTNVIIPDSVIDIGCDAFNNCVNLSSITIPSTIKKIYQHAFVCCSNLTSIVIENGITNIMYGAFAESGLREVILPNSLNTISYILFEGCLNLTNVIIPDSIQIIGEAAFQNCDSLTIITIPASVTNIVEMAFNCCDNLEEFIVDEDNPAYKSIDGLLLTKDGKELIHGVNGDIIIPNDVKNIQDRAFLQCYNLNSIIIPNSVTNIGNWAFKDVGLTDVVIPDNVIRLGANSFNSCSNLINLTLSDTINIIGADAFQNCANLPNVRFPNNNKLSVGSTAFANCNSLTNVIIPKNVKELKDGIFSYSGNIKSFNVDPDNAYFKSENGLLLSKNGKTLYYGVSGDVIIPSGVESTRYYSFCGRNTTSVIIPDSVKNLAGSTFYFCGSLTNAIIGNGVTSINNNLFCYCTNLTSVAFSDNVKNIDSQAFYYCTKLDNITIGNNVTNIGNSAFCNCWNLSNITIGNNVKSISGSAFNGCTSLSSIIIPESVTTIGSSVFLNCNQLSLIEFQGKNSTDVKNMSNYSNWKITAGCTIRCIKDGNVEEFLYP